MVAIVSAIFHCVTKLAACRAQLQLGALIKDKPAKNYKSVLHYAVSSPFKDVRLCQAVDCKEIGSGQW